MRTELAVKFANAIINKVKKENLIEDIMENLGQEDYNKWLDSLFNDIKGVFSLGILFILLDYCKNNEELKEDAEIREIYETFKGFLGDECND